jgi:hypothetical protein
MVLWRFTAASPPLRREREPSKHQPAPEVGAIGRRAAAAASAFPAPAKPMRADAVNSETVTVDDPFR